MTSSPHLLADGFFARSSPSNSSSSCSVYSSETSVASSSSDDAPLITRRSSNRRVDHNSAVPPLNISISSPPVPISRSTIHPHSARTRAGRGFCNLTDIAPMRLDDPPLSKQSSSPPPASFDNLNEDWEPPIQDLPPVPEFIHDVITSMMRDV